MTSCISVNHNWKLSRKLISSIRCVNVHRFKHSRHVMSIRVIIWSTSSISFHFWLVYERWRLTRILWYYVRHVNTIIICPLIVCCHAGRPRQIEWISYFPQMCRTIHTILSSVIISIRFHGFNNHRCLCEPLNVSIVWRKMHFNFQHSVEYDYWTSIKLSH